MPTITPATTMSLVTGAPGKAPASLLTPGDPSPDFQTLLCAAVPVAPAIPADAIVVDQPVRQPIAADGTTLPVTAIAIPTATATVKAEALPIDVMPAVAIATVATALKPAAQPQEAPPPAPATTVPPLATITVAVRQQPIVSTKRAAHDRKPDRPEEAEDADTPVDPVVTPPSTPLIPATPLPLVAIRAAKDSPLPAISVARPLPGSRPVIAAAMPPATRDLRWEGAAPVVTPLPDQPALPMSEALPIGAIPQPAVIAATPANPRRLPATDAVPQAPPPVQSAPPPAVPLPLAVSATPPAIVVGPALQVFGAAISAAARRERGEEAADLPTSLGAVAPLAAPVAGAVAPSSQPTLDMRQERWPQAMIAHIEKLRDTADAGDTRIRLIPDALGTIDVAVTRDRGTLHVQFAAEQATTRTLIQDAQPRLAALAEERGLRLGQTVVDAGAASATSQQPQQSQQQRQPQRDAALPAAPRVTHSNDDQDPADDGRLA